MAKWGILFFLVASAAAQDAGAVEIMNRWTHRGGPPAGTAASATPVHKQKPVEAWTQVAQPGTHWVEEPRVHEGNVYLVRSETKNRKTTRLLHLIDLSNGQMIGSPLSFAVEAEVGVALLGDDVFLRSAPDEISGYRRGRASLVNLFRVKRRDELVGLPLAMDGALYFQQGEALVAYDIKRRRELWRLPGTYRGRPSGRGPWLYSLRYRDDHAAEVVQIDRQAGKEVSSLALGFHSDESVPNRSDDVHIAITKKRVFLSVDKPLLSSNGMASQFVEIKLLGEGERQRLGGALILPATHVPIEVGGGHLFHAEGDTGIVYAREPDGPEGQVLALTASKSHHAAYDDVRAPVLAGGTALLGLRAVDLSPDTLDFGLIHWEIGGRGDRRVIPVRETLLTWDAQRVVAWRAPTADSGETAYLKPDAKAATAELALASGDVWRGPVRWKPDGDLILDSEAGSKAKPRTFRKADVLAVLVDGAIWQLAPGEAGQRGLDFLAADAELRGALAVLSRAVEETKDPEVIEPALDRTQAAGATEEDLADFARKLELAKKKPKPAEPATKTAISAALDALGSAARERAMRLYTTLPADVSRAMRFALLRRYVETWPEDPAGALAVLPLIPETIRPRGNFPVLEWLEFAEASAASTITLMKPPSTNETNVSPERLWLGHASLTWREDLSGFQSENLVIFTPLDRPGVLARCLRLGEQLCDELESLTVGGAHDRDTRYRLRIHLFASRDEYLKQKDLGKGGYPNPSLVFTAGYFSPEERISRFYVPKVQEGGLERALRTYQHELTHHWIAERCRRIKRFDVFQTINAPGYWIVEGFASLVEDFDFDDRGRLIRTLDPRSFAIDLVSHAEPATLIDWKSLLTLSHGTYSGNLQKNRKFTQAQHEVALRWRLGAAQPISQARIFYDQSLAVCAYLFHAEEGRLRPRLMDYLTLYYTGKTTATSIKDIFGCDEETLGQRVIAWAKEVVAKAN